MSALQGRILEGLKGQQYRVAEPVDLDELGSPKGAMARVFRVYDLQNNRYLAAKIINPRLLDDEMELRERFLAQFYKEARIMEELQHPAIARLYDYNTQGELPFLIMEHIEGETLDDKLRREGRLSFVEAMDILDSVTQALAYAHSRGVVHRDIKPSNILLDSRGRAYLTDFGIARAAQESGLSTRTALTLGSYQFGTPMYMAPEQALRLSEAVGPHTDQYSLAVVTWRMLAGRYYLARTDSKDVKDYSSLVVASKPLPLSRYAPTVPPRAEQAIVRALSKSPYERFESVLDFLEELKRAKANPDLTPIVNPLAGWEEPDWLSASPPPISSFSAIKAPEPAAPQKQDDSFFEFEPKISTPLHLEPKVTGPIAAEQITGPTPPATATGPLPMEAKITAPTPPATATGPLPVEKISASTIEKKTTGPLTEPSTTGPIGTDKTPSEPLDLKLPDWLESGAAAATVKQEQALPTSSFSEMWFKPEPAAPLAKSPEIPKPVEAEPLTTPKPRSNSSQPLAKPRLEGTDPWVLKAGSYPGAKAEPGRYRLNWMTAHEQEKWAYNAIRRKLRGPMPFFLKLAGPLLGLIVGAVLTLVSGLALPIAAAVAVGVALVTLLFVYVVWQSRARSVKGLHPTILTGWLVRVGGAYEKTASGKIVLKEGRAPGGQVNPSILTIATSTKTADDPDQTYSCEIWGEDKIELPPNSLNQRVAIATINDQAAGLVVVAVKVLTHI